MSAIIEPGAGVLYMKVGTHAKESLEDIVERKSREIREAGYGMWGYGGNTCHPSTMVQPFAREFHAKGRRIHLVMEEMDSKHFAEPDCAAEYSVDGVEWKLVPEEIEVRGSRYALTIKNLRPDEIALPLHRTRVPVGPSTGRLGSRYVQGRVDKACLVVDPPGEGLVEEERVERGIGLVAELVEPYAVFLRNYRR